MIGKTTTFQTVTRIAAPLASILRKLVSRLRIVSPIMLLCATTTTGCLLGPPIEGLPEEELHPPRIALDQVDPAMEGSIPVLNSTECLMKRFSLGKVTDENTGDTLTVRWLLDWKGANKPDGILTDHNILPTGSVDRFDPFALDLDFQLSRITSNLDGAHTITAVVADRPLVNSSAIGFADTEEGREGLYDVYQWTIELEDAGLCDQEK